MEKKYEVKDYTKYKTDIALPDFLISNYNFKPMRDSTFCSPKLQGPDGQVIVIRMNKLGYYTYFDIHNDNIKGYTILDFLKQEMGREGKAPSLYSIAQVLDEYMRSGKVLTPDKSKYYITKSDGDVDLLLKEIKPLSDRSFLYERGINDETIDSEIFKGIFLEREFIKDGSRYLNTIIKLFNENGIAGFSQRNSHFKGCLLSRADTLAISNFDQHKPIDIYFIGESMLDNASHYQMNRERLKDKNVVYFSSEGSFNLGQLELFQKSVNFMKPENIVSLFDRDAPGQEYNLKLFGNLILKERRGEGIKTEVIRDITQGIIELNITMPEMLAKEKLKYFNEEYFGRDISEQWSFELQNLKKENLVNLKLSFQRTFENIDNMVNKLREFRLEDCNLDRQIPLTNDFNDDLRARLGIHKFWKIENVNGREVGVPISEKNIDTVHIIV